MRFIYLLFLLPFTASAQCDPEGILLELQATTAKVGILFAEDGCIDAITVGSPLTFTGGVLDITSGDLTAASSKITVTGGTGAVLGSGATVDVVPANILLSTLGGTLNLSQIGQGGATLNQVMQWNGTTWAPATATATTDLTFSGASSPVTLNSSTGTDVTITAGTGISLAGTGADLTISGTAAGLSKWTDAGAYTYLTATTDRSLVGSSTEINSSYILQANGGLFVKGTGATSSTYTAQFQNSTGTNNGLVVRDDGLVGIGTSSLSLGQLSVESPITGIYALITPSASSGQFYAQNLNINTTGLTGSAGFTGFGFNRTGTAPSGSSYLFRFQDNSSDVFTGRSSGEITHAPLTLSGFGSYQYNGVNTSAQYGFFRGTNSMTGISFRNALTTDNGTGIGFRFSVTTNSAYTPVSNTAAKVLVVGNGQSPATDVAYIKASGESYFAGPVGIANTSPAQTLHVTGTARITGSDGTATTVMGRDADGDISALSLSGMSISAGTLTATDGSTTNELQTIANTSDETSHTVTLSNSGGSVQLVEGSGVTLTTTGTSGAGVVTIAATGAGTDLAFSGASSPVTLNSSTGTDVTFTAGGINTLSASGTNITITATEVDGSTTNELQTYGHAGTTTYTNTLSSGGGSWSITGAGIAAISQTAGAITVTATEVDGSVTNEAQTLSTSGTTSGILTLSTAGGAGGGTATIAAGTGITVAQSAGTITITNSSPATAGWLLDGNTIGSAKRIGSNDNFDVVVETNGTDRMWFDNGGAVSIGTTQSTAAQLVIKGLLSSNGVLIDAGGTLTGPTFYAATGSGSGSNATVLSGVVSMLNGNVEGLFKNTSATGTGGALLTLNTHQSATGDPKVVWTTNDVTTWAAGIDNSISGEPWKLTPNSDIGAATPAISSTTANKVGINQAAAVVTLQVTGTDAIGLPTGTTAQRSAAAIPQIRHNNTFSGLEFYDQNKGYWYRLTAISTPTVVSNTAAGTGHSGNVLAGELSSDVRGVLELNTGSASTAVGTVMTVTYASAYSGTKTVVLLDAGNDIATTQRNRFRVDTQSNTGFTIRAVTALDINETYVIKYYVGQ